VHPYKRPVIGYEEDIRSLTRSDVQQFFDTYYVPSNLTVAIVGDVTPDKVKQLAQVYFGLQGETSTSRARGSGTPPEVNQEVSLQPLLSLVFGGLPSSHKSSGSCGL